MCTLSVIPPFAGRGLRLVVNRDERRTRAAAWPPRYVRHDSGSAVWPVDPDSLGTWVAATASGLVLALVNLNRFQATATPAIAAAMRRVTDAEHRMSARTSRGHIIPALVAARSLEDAARQFARLDLTPFSPFRLCIAHGALVALHEWDGSSRRSAERTLHAPWMISSSSLGDHLVEPPRSRLFAELLARHADPWDAQDHLHQHAWPDRRELSVLMTRATARTVSRTAIVVGDEVVTMSYAPVIDGWIGPTVATELALSDAGQAVCA